MKYIPTPEQKKALDRAKAVDREVDRKWREERHRVQKMWDAAYSDIRQSNNKMCRELNAKSKAAAKAKGKWTVYMQWRLGCYPDPNESIWHIIGVEDKSFWTRDDARRWVKQFKPRPQPKQNEVIEKLAKVAKELGYKLERE